MADRFEYYITGEDGAAGFYATKWKAQTFTTLAVGFTISSVKLLVYKIGAPGTVTISIKAVDGNNKPTDADLASITDDPTSYTTSTAGAWVEYTFSIPYALSASTRYAIVMRTASGDLDNRVMPKADISSPTYANGESLLSSDSGSNWTAVSSVDILFETWGDPILPGKPTNPSPSHTGSDITLDETPLSWDASDPAADTYEVYFRIQGDSWVRVGDAQAAVNWAIAFGTLGYETTYEWRIDATNIYGTTTGDTWNFGSINYDQIRVSYRLISGGNGAGPYDNPPGTQGTDWEYTGLNFMTTIRRLVVAANSTIFYEQI